MFRGFYTAAAGMLMQQRTLNTHANNIANIGTPGHKSDMVISSTFHEEFMQRKERGNNATIGKGNSIRVVDDVPTIYTVGGLKESDRPFDFCINGDGFFRISGYDGENYLTRNGNFDLDNEGYLVLRGVGRVQGEDGDINIGRSDFVISSPSTISVVEDGDLIDIANLDIVTVENTTFIERAANGHYLYTAEEALIEVDSNVIQYALEMSNIDLNREMASVMESQRNFQTASSALRVIDQINAKTVSEIAKL